MIADMTQEELNAVLKWVYPEGGFDDPEHPLALAYWHLLGANTALREAKDSLEAADIRHGKLSLSGFYDLREVIGRKILALIATET